MSDRSVLEGVRVVDLGGIVACAAASLVFAEAGADVVMVEPPGGSPLRALPGFRTWGRSKRSVVADLATDEGRNRLEELLADADVLLHALSPAAASAIGLDDASLARRHPRLVVSSVLGWPANHEAAEAPADDHLVLARLGVLDEQLGARGESPIYVRFPLGTWPAAWLAVIGVMARLVNREQTGRAGPAHTSLAQGALVPMMMHWLRAETPSDAVALGMPKDRMRATLFECGDGRWIHVMPPPPDHTPLVQEVLAELGPEVVARENARLAADGPPGWVNWGALVEAFRRRPAATWLEHLWANDIPAQGAVGLGEILADEQARVNDYVVDVDDPEVGPIATAGLPLTLDPPMAVKWPAPPLGAHTGWADPAERATPSEVVGGPPTTYPLEGLKVLDLGNFLAGPLGPMILADLGATVVKVEAGTGDPMRGVEWAFAGCQRGKRSVALDIKAPASRPALDALLGWADVVHHNLRLPAARRLGLDSAAVRAVNPAVVFCHVSSYGPDGPRADWPGYDQMFQASCGWEVAGAGLGNPPMWHRFGFMDHLCALGSVAATLMALYRSATTGIVSDVAASLLGAGVVTNSETYRHPDGRQPAVAVLDAEQMTVDPGRRILRAADGWIAVAADTEAQLTALCRSLGVNGAGELPAAVAARSASDVVDLLVAAAVPATVVRQGQKGPFFDDAAHRAAGLVASYPHGAWGRLEQPGAMWWFGDQQVQLHRAPPLLGEHTVEVLLEVGMERSDVDRLIENGAAVAR